MAEIGSVEELRDLLGVPVGRAVTKERTRLYAVDRQFTLSIEAIAQLDPQAEQESHQGLITSTANTALRRSGISVREHKSDSS